MKLKHAVSSTILSQKQHHGNAAPIGLLVTLVAAALFSSGAYGVTTEFRQTPGRPTPEGNGSNVGAANVAADATPAVKTGAGSTALAAKDRIAAQRADSVDMGDSYGSPFGRRYLHRRSGAVALRLFEYADTEAVVAYLTRAGGPLEGHEMEAEYRSRIVVLQRKTRPSDQQFMEAQVQQRVMAEAVNQGVEQTGPVFVDPNSGLWLVPTQEIIVQLKEGVDPNSVLNGFVFRRPPATACRFLVDLSGASAEDLFAAADWFSSLPGVAWAEPDFLTQQLLQGLNDPYYPQQWHLDNSGQGGGAFDADVDASEAWAVTGGGNSDVVIAVLDCGVQTSHPDLRDNIFTNSGEIPGNGIDDDNNGYADDIHGWDFYAGGNDANPRVACDKHGTTVAGVAVARGNNGIGVAGLAYNCRLLPIRIGETSSDCRSVNICVGSTCSNLSAAICYAAGVDDTGAHRWRGADVLNCSTGMYNGTAIRNALNLAATRGRNGKGCPVFCAAGNDASGWQTCSITGIPAGTYTFRWEYRKDASVSQGDDTAWLDSVLFPGGEQQRFESSSLPSGWTTGGNAGWYSVRDGQNGNHAMTGWDGENTRSVRAGAIGHSGSSYLQVTKTVSAGTLVFSVWVSCEAGFDGLYFYMNGISQYDGPAATGSPTIVSGIAFPASHPDTIAVGSSTNFDYRADHSRTGPELDFLAPGGGGSVDMWTTDRTGADGYDGGDYSARSGTSFASPLAAGVAALMLSKSPALTALEIRGLMRLACDQIGSLSYPDGRNDYYGYGRINARKALDRIDAPTTPATPGDSYEPDDSAGSAKTITAGATQNHSLHVVGDVDWVKFTLTQASAVTIDTNGGSGDSELWLYGPNSSTTPAPAPNQNDDAHGLWAKIEHSASNPLPPGTYYIKVGEHGNNATIAAYTLSLTVTPVTSSVDPPGTTPLTINAWPKSAYLVPNSTNWHSFTVETTHWYEIKTWPVPPLDTLMKLYGPNDYEKFIAQDDDSGEVPKGSKLRVTLSPGKYYVNITGFGNDGAYTIQVWDGGPLRDW